jgi:hypothetical protein
MRSGKACEVERAVEINLNDLFPVVSIELFNWSGRTRDACVVDEYIKAP